MAGPLTAGHVLLKLVADYAGFTQELDGLAKNAEKRFEGISTAGAMALTAMGGAIVGGLGVAVKSAVEFQSAIAAIGTLGVKDLAPLEESIKKIAVTYGIDLVDGAKAAYDAISSGVDAADAPRFLEAAAMAAAAAQTDLSTATQLGTSITNAFGLEMKDVSVIFDQAFVAAKDGVTTFEELAGSVGKVAPLMAAAGMTSKEMFSAVSSLTLAGLDTNEAVTRLTSAFSNIVTPSEKATKLAQELGIEFDVASLKTLGLSGFMEMLKEKTGGSVEVMGQLFGSSEALVSMLVLTGNQAGQFNETLTTMTNTTGATAEAFQVMVEKDPALAFRILRAEMQVLAVEIGTALLPAIMSVVASVKPAIQSMIEWSQEHPKLLAGIVGLSAALGGLALVTGTVSLAWGGIAAVLGLIGPIASGIATVFTIVAGAVVAAVGSITLAGAAMAVGIAAAVAAIVIALNWVVENWEYVKSILVEFPGAIAEVWMEIGSAIKDAIGSAIDWVIDKVAEGWEALKGFFGFGGGDVELPAGSVPGAASGGMVRRGGFVEVGEHGKELLFLPRGAEVVSSPATEAILRGGAGMGGSVNASVVIHSPMVDSEERLQRLAGEISRRQGWMLKEALSLRGV